MRALVFSGGGSRGAYEVGAWQALSELGVRFGAVYGTSIGAVNAALMAQGRLEEAVALWENITVSQVMSVQDDEDFAIGRMVSRKRDVIPFLLENARRLRMDISPLERLIKAHVDEMRVRASGMRLGVVVFRVPQMQGVIKTLDNMNKGSLCDWVIASASCFPVFKARYIDGQAYIDGGYYDNLPVDLALADQADEVVAVDIHPEHTHPEYARMPWMTVIKPRHDLGGFLDFNHQLLHRSRLMGYYDAMKVYRRFDGHLYTFRHVSDLAVTNSARAFMRRVTDFDAECIHRGILYSGQPVNAPLMTALEAETDRQPLSWKDIWLRGLELCAQAMAFREDAIYESGDLIRRIREYCEKQTFQVYFDEAGIQTVSEQGSRALLAFVYQGIVRHGGLPSGVIHRLSDHPIQTAAALFLFTQTQI